MLRRIGAALMAVLSVAVGYAGVGLVWSASGVQPGSVSDMEGEAGILAVAGIGLFVVAATVLYGASKVWRARHTA